MKPRPFPSSEREEAKSALGSTRVKPRRFPVLIVIFKNHYGLLINSLHRQNKAIGAVKVCLTISQLPPSTKRVKRGWHKYVNVEGIAP